MANKIPSLKLPLWSEIIYFLLIAVGPIVVTACELFSSHSTVFKITFASVGALLITSIIIKKFVFNTKIKKLQAECLNCEHDYSMEIGNPDNAVKKWCIYNIIIFLYHCLVIALSLILALLFISALSEGLIKFKGAATLILIFVLVALLFRLFVYFGFMKTHLKKDNENENPEK